MLTASPALLKALSASHERRIVCSVTPPGGATEDFDITGGSATAQSGTGARYGASLDVAVDTYLPLRGNIQLPGAIFDVSVQVRVAGGSFESIPIFHGELSTAPDASFYGGGFTVGLSDQWQRIARCRFLTPYTSTSATRSSLISNLVTGAIPGAAIVTTAVNGGSTSGGTTWDKDRTQAITDLAGDGGMECGFNAPGSFLIRDTPALKSVPDWTVTDGDGGALISGSSNVPVDKLYNTLVVQPSTSDQTWSPVVVQVSDSSSPRHKSKIGVVPFFWSSPAITSSAAAVSTGTQMLQRIIQASQTEKITSVDFPPLEPGDTVLASTQASPARPQVQYLGMVSNITRDLVAGTMQVEIITNPDVAIEQVS